MFKNLTLRWKYLQECYRHSLESRIALIVAAVFWIYGAATQIGPFVDGVGPWMQRAHLPTVSWTLLIVAAVAALVFILIEGGYRLNQESLAKISELQTAGQYPQLQLKINEIVVMPAHCAADCFLNVMVHNIAADVVSTMEQFALGLDIGGKRYSGSVLFDIQNYERAVYSEDYDEDTGQVEETRSSSGIKVFDHEAVLRRGIPINGWLHFRINGVPNWPSHIETIGQSIEYDDQGNESVVDDEETTLKADNIISANLRVVDAFGREHIVESSGPFWNWIVKVERKRKAVAH